jgi:uncharacterized protein YgiM (DUF1202 family)
MIRKILFAFILIMLCPALSYSFDLYVHSVKAPIYATPSMSSEKLTEIPKGTKLTGTSENPSWYEVQYKNVNGWVYKLMVKKSPPMEKTGVFSRLKSLYHKIHTLREKSRRRPSSFTTTAAARGLREKRERFSDKYQLAYTSLERLESIEISDNEALEFLTKGVSDEKYR